jgi:hypothetical protein
MAITRRGNTARFELNGVWLIEEELHPSSSTAFGLYCPADVSTMQIRNATLKGDWPKVLPSDLFGN